MPAQAGGGGAAAHPRFGWLRKLSLSLLRGALEDLAEGVAEVGWGPAARRRRRLAEAAWRWFDERSFEGPCSFAAVCWILDLNDARLRREVRAFVRAARRRSAEAAPPDPESLSGPERRKLAVAERKRETRRLLAAGVTDVGEIARRLGVSRDLARWYVRQARGAKGAGDGSSSSSSSLWAAA
jgi:DNA-binding CsgD family transcriptional regulator